MFCTNCGNEMSEEEQFLSELRRTARDSSIAAAAAASTAGTGDRNAAGDCAVSER